MSNKGISNDEVKSFLFVCLAVRIFVIPTFLRSPLTLNAAAEKPEVKTLNSGCLPPCQLGRLRSFPVGLFPRHETGCPCPDVMEGRAGWAWDSFRKNSVSLLLNDGLPLSHHAATGVSASTRGRRIPDVFLAEAVGAHAVELGVSMPASFSRVFPFTWGKCQRAPGTHRHCRGSPRVWSEHDVVLDESAQAGPVVRSIGRVLMSAVALWNTGSRELPCRQRTVFPS